MRLTKLLKSGLAALAAGLLFTAPAPGQEVRTAGYGVPRDECEAAFPLFADPFGPWIYENFADLRQATNVSGHASSCGNAIGPDVWGSYTPASSGTITITTEGSSFDTVLAAYNGCPSTGGTEIICNDDVSPGIVHSTLTFAVVSGQTYYIRVGGYNGATGIVRLTLDGPFPVGAVAPTDPAAPAHVGSVAHIRTANSGWIHEGFDSFPADDLSVAMWINSDMKAGAHSLLSYAVTGSTNEFLLFLPNSGPSSTLDVYFKAAVQSIPIPDVRDGQWHHVAVTRRRASGLVTVFIDGVQAGTVTMGAGQGFAPGGTLVLGQDQDTVGGGFQTNQAFVGRMDEVAIWSRELPAATITSLQTAAASLDDATLEANWRFNAQENHGVGSTAFSDTPDESGNLRHLAALVTGASQTAHDTSNLSGAGTGGELGRSTSGIGDVNGDGFEDYLTGMPGRSSNTGSAYLVWGAPGQMPNNQGIDAAVTNGRAIRFDGQAAGDRFGTSVSGAGDVNGDGVADFLIGAPGRNGDAGGAYLIYGGEHLAGQQTWSMGSMIGSLAVRFNGPVAGARVGEQVSGGGDMNGDGYADFLVGGVSRLVETQVIEDPEFLMDPAVTAWTPTSCCGATAVWEASPGRMRFTTNQDSGAGVEQIVPLPVGASRVRLTMNFSQVQSSLNTVRVVARNASGSFLGVPLFTNFGAGVTQLGPSAIPAGAVDLFCEIDTGNACPHCGPTNDVSILESFHLYVEAATAPAAQQFVVLGLPGGWGSSGAFNLSTLGSVTDAGRRGARITPAGIVGSFTGIGDFNGDGYDDAFFGAPALDGGTGLGSVMLGRPRKTNGVGIGYNGIWNYLSIPEQTIDGVNERFAVHVSDLVGNSLFGEVSAPMGDINNDGLADFFVTGSQRTRGHVVYGTEAITEINPPTGGSGTTIQFPGTIVDGAGVGDITGDGVGDLYVAQANRSYILSGQTIASNAGGLYTPSASGPGLTPLSSESFGSVAHAGDIGGDGTSDYITGVPFPGTSAGRVRMNAGQHDPGTTNQFANRIRHGNGGNPSGMLPIRNTVPAKGVGRLGDGSHLKPLSGVTLSFRGGDAFLPDSLLPSTQTVDVNYTRPPKPFEVDRGAAGKTVFKTVPKVWKIETDRVDFDRANLKFHLSPRDLAGMTEADKQKLGVYRVSTTNDPFSAFFNPSTWQPLEVVGVDTLQNTVTAVINVAVPPDDPGLSQRSFNGYYAVFSGAAVYELGDEIVPPATVDLARLPNAGPNVLPLGSTLWHQTEKKLYAIRPGSGIQIDWVDDTDPSRTSMGFTIASFIWPGEALDPFDNKNHFFQFHVTETPEIPLGVAGPGGATIATVALATTETDADPAQVSSMKSFSAARAGRSMFIFSTGSNPFVDPIYFQFAWSLPFQALTHSRAVDVGTDLGEWAEGIMVNHHANTAASVPMHDLEAGEPYMHSELGFYCADSGYYDRSSAPLTGPLIPVNLDLTGRGSGDDDFDVTFYEKGVLLVDPLDRTAFLESSIYWPTYPVELDVQWPALPLPPQQALVIASQIGSGPLVDTAFKAPSLYVQNTRTLPGPDEEDGTADDITLLGFNPNEEHALMITQDQGPAVFALRDDLGRADTSEPFVLVKYLDPTDQDRPSISLFSVQQTDATSDFHYDSPRGLVGSRVESPYPLRTTLFPTCKPSAPGAFDGNYTTTADLIRQDRTGAFWAISAGPNDSDIGTIRMHYFYQLRTNFYVPEEYKTALAGTGLYDMDEEFGPGTCVPWLDDWWDEGGGMVSANAGTPVEVSYEVEWPAGAPVLFAAESLVDPKRGLPGIDGADSVDVVYWQSLDAGMGKSVDLIDPTRERFVPMAMSIEEKLAFQAEVRTVRLNGVLEFEDIVPHIRRRLIWDDSSQRLIFRGSYVKFIAGEDMLLPNVMTLRERDQILALSTNPTFEAAVLALYEKTQGAILISFTNFSRQDIDATLTGGGAVAYGDFDKDGLQDAFVARAGGTIEWYINETDLGNGWTKMTQSALTFPGTPLEILAADFDADGDDDIVFATDSTLFRNVFHLVNNGTTWTKKEVVGSAMADITGMAVGDIDQDGDLDLVIASSTLAPRWYEFNGNNSTWTKYDIANIGTDTTGIDVADFDGDGWPDIVACNAGTLNHVRWYLNDQTPKSSSGSDWLPTLIEGTVLDAPSDVFAVDLNGDTFMDVLTASAGNDRVFWHQNKPGQDPAWESRRVVEGFTDVSDVHAADLDGDGDIDLVAASPTDDRLTWFENSGQVAPSFEAHNISNLLDGVSQVRVVDIDGDGNLDIAPGRYDLSGGVMGLAWYQSDGASRDVWASLALTSALAQGTGYVTLMLNNAEDSTGAVSVEVIRVECPFTRGDVKIIYPDCPFNERVALRHNGDFAGQADNFEFDWWFMDAATYLQILVDTGAPPIPPEPGVADNGWTDYVNDGVGAVDIALSDPSGEIILSDLFWTVRYRPADGFTTVCGQVYSPWTDGALTEGWVKRVIGDFGPFRQRATGGGIQGAEDNFVDYTTRTVSTIVSMISQAGERWEGNVPLSCNNVDGLGLIEVYQSVLNRAKVLSIFAIPRLNLDQFTQVLDDEGNVVSSMPGPDGVPDGGISASVSNALLLAAGRIADLYALLGNEAYADGSDPTIAFGTDDGVFGPVATAIHPFMNQASGLLEEELFLLRGRDNSSLPSIQVRPVYNRLIWNFTNDFTGGEVAYALNYAINDVNGDSLIDEVDAARLYPQGHGDAWGHYLSALKAYYDLIRQPEFAWVPRTEPVLVGGQPVEVDYFDERKFATVASLMARTGQEIVNLTYRASFVEDPEIQWQGYLDSNPDRAWGLSEWGARSGMGAYFNWVTANALIPPDDGSVQPASIRKVDRNSVGELQEIAAAFEDIQRQLDRADAGVNPLGLAGNSVPFDINPVFLTLDFMPITHFEQVFERAMSAMENAQKTFDYAAAATLALRRQADDVNDFQIATEDTEIDFKNRLIEVFGTPYPDDIGPGGTYPQGYNGPDLFHWLYFDPSQLQQLDVQDLETRTITGRFRKDLNFQELIDDVDFEFTDNELTDIDGLTPPPSSIGEEFEVTYEISDKYGAVRPADWTAPRRVYGEIQLAQMELYEEITDFRENVDNYCGFLLELDDALATLQLRYNIAISQLEVVNTAQGTAIAMDVVRFIALTAEKSFNATKESTVKLSDAGKEAIPRVVGFSNDIGSPVRAVIALSGTVTSTLLQTLEIASSLVGEAASITAGQVDRQADIAIRVSDSVADIQDQVATIRNILLNETTLRFELLKSEQRIYQKAIRHSQVLQQGNVLLESRSRFRRKTSARVQNYRYKDMAFRIFRNEAVQKYRAALDLAARYAWLAVKAFDYETNLLGDDPRGPGAKFLTDIVRARTIGVFTDGEPQIGGINGDPGLSDPLARLWQSWSLTLSGQLGFNNPQIESSRFSLRRELFRIGLESDASEDLDIDDADARWREVLKRPFGNGNNSGITTNLFALPEFRRYCIPFSAPPSDPLLANEPAIVFRFGSNVNFAQNFFVNFDEGQAWPLGSGDSSYDSTNFATKIRSVGLWFSNYNTLAGGGMSNTPRVYLIPTGTDLLRSPTGNRGKVRAFNVLDQAVPSPFPLGGSDLGDPDWVPAFDTLSEGFVTLRRYASFRAYHDAGFDPDEMTFDSRLIGRSVWNTEWLLIIPGGTLHSNRDEGIRRFIYGRLGTASDGSFVLDDQGNQRDGNGVDDILMFFQTYAYSGQ